MIPNLKTKKSNFGDNMRFQDVPQFTKYSEYRINQSWQFLENFIESLGLDFKLELDPDFQRAHVWDEEKQIRYIEFICKGGRSGKDIYFNCPSFKSGRGDDTMVLVDGKQRLEAVMKFLRNELPVFGGNYYKDFSDKLRMGHHEFVIHINDLSTRKEILQWYIDINDGGVVHTKEEIDKVRNMIAKKAD